MRHHSCGGALGLLSLALTLSACGERGGETAGSGDASVTREEVVSRASEIVKPQPGLYRATVEVTELDFPNVPPQVKDMMANSANSNQARDYCVTPEDVEKGFEEALRKSQQGDCEYKKFDVEGGRIDAVMTCTQQGRSVNMTLSGTGTSTSSDMTMAMEMDMPGVGKGTIKARSSNRRIGDCPAG